MVTAKGPHLSFWFPEKQHEKQGLYSLASNMFAAQIPLSTPQKKLSKGQQEFG
jgi:hypothetical protein